MKILYLHQYFSTPKGAWGTRAYEFARRWVSAGDSVTIVTSAYDRSDMRSKGLVSKRVVDGINVIVVGIGQSNKHWICRRLFTFVAYAVVATWYALTIDTDVVISSSPPITVAIPGLLARRFRKKWLVFEVRDLWPDVLIEMGLIRSRFLIWLGKAFERYCYSHADAIIPLSEGIADAIGASASVGRLEIVSNASDNAAFASARSLIVPDWAEGRHLVVYAGCIGYSNQCLQLLEMAAVIKERGGAGDIRIVLIGDGRERPELERKAREMQLEHVRFLGQMSREDVNSWLRAACCALLVFRNAPLTASGSPNKLFDAFAAGLPVIHNTPGWIKKLIDHEQCGLSVPPDDPIALAEAVLRLTKDLELQRQYAMNSRRLGRERFDRDVLAKKMQNVLHEAI